MIYKVEHVDAELGFFRCDFNGAPASVLVNLELGSDARDENRPVLLSVWIKMRAPNDQGLSGPAEGPAYDNLSAALESAITAQMDALFAGQITRAGRWELYFYAANERHLKNVVRQAILGTPEYLYSVGSKIDANWEFYKQSLYPSNQKDLQQILNYSLIRHLRESGVSLARPLNMVHRVLAGNETNVNALVGEICRRGYTQQEGESGSDMQDGSAKVLLVGRFEIIDLTSLNQSSLELIDICNMNAGRYMGCECVV